MNMDADDLIDQDMYEVLIKNLDMTNSDVSACSYVKEYNLDRGKIIGLHKIIPDPIVFMDNTQKSFGSTAGRIVRAWHGVRYCWH